MRFGIYPGGRVATTCSRPDDPAAIDRLVTGLGPLVVREYVHFAEPDVLREIGGEHELDRLTMPDEWYVRDGRELDLVVSYIPREADIDGWLAFLDQVIERYGHLVRYLQVTLEPNFPVPLIDGSSPGVLDALTRGIPHARGKSDALIGFSVAEPAEWLGGDDYFWRHPAESEPLPVDYVGLGLYPDAFSPVPPEHVAPLTLHALRQLRTRIPASVPIHIAENGSPSGVGRGERRQAESLAAMLTTILAHAEELNIAQYELFALRDADSGAAEAVGSLGLVTDSYQPKAAYATFRELISGGTGTS